MFNEIVGTNLERLRFDDQWYSDSASEMLNSGSNLVSGQTNNY